jgi:hypothetical protein
LTYNKQIETQVKWLWNAQKKKRSPDLLMVRSRKA